MNKKYAVCMLCMLKDHYVVGACMSAFAHKSLISSGNLDIDLVIMCDEYIYDKYNHTLKFYFDKVVKIKMFEVTPIIHPNVFTPKSWKSKYTWLTYSLNKWQCLKYSKYEKILFMDVDILPMRVELYNIFKFNTPAFKLNYSNINLINCVNNEKIHDILNYINSYSDYIGQTSKKYCSLDAGLVLLTPSKSEYNEYMNYVKELINQNNGKIYQTVYSGVDETTLFYFYAKYKKEKTFYRICEDNIDIPWKNSAIHNVKSKDEVVNAYNYLSYVKPWRKAKFIAWKEERIWRDIYKIMMKTRKFNELYKKTLVEGTKEYCDYGIDLYKQCKYYNDEFKKKLIDLNNLNYNDIVVIENELIIGKDYGNLNEQSVKQLFDCMNKLKILYNNV